jgi:hypothetical protein
LKEEKRYKAKGHVMHKIVTEKFPNPKKVFDIQGQEVSNTKQT